MTKLVFNTSIDQLATTKNNECVNSLSQSESIFTELGTAQPPLVIDMIILDTNVLQVIILEINVLHVILLEMYVLHVILLQMYVLHVILLQMYVLQVIILEIKICETLPYL